MASFGPGKASGSPSGWSAQHALHANSGPRIYEATTLPLPTSIYLFI